MYVVRRSKNNPLLSPRTDQPWEAHGTFNGCPVKKGGSTYMLYRALGRPDALMTPSGISTIGRAASLDGEKFQTRTQFIIPEESWEQYGCEDPRVTFFEGKYVIFYTALGGIPFTAENIKVGVALSRDLEHIDEKHLVTPFNAKAMTLFPERINGKVTALLTVHTDRPPAKIAVVQCDELEDLWNPAFWRRWYKDWEKHVIDPRRSENDHVEVGSQPVKTKDGWLVFYSYIQDYFSGMERRVCGIEALLLDLNNPQNVVGKTHGPLLIPEESYEKFGMVPNIVFPSGVLVEKNRVDLYYNGADTVCAKASMHLPDLLAAMKPETRGDFAVRAKENPILQPVPEHPWENKSVCNAGAVDIDGVAHILYRASGDDNVSKFGYASSNNGVKISQRDTEPAYVPRAEFEARRGPDNIGSGCEDPRLSRIGDIIYLTYTAFSGIPPWRGALSSISVKDFVAKRWNKWAAPMLVTPDAVPDKDVCIFPEKFNEGYLVLHRIDPILCADYVQTLDFKKSRMSRCIEIMAPRPGFWDSVKIGSAGPPIKTDKGWLLIYHGVSKTMTYRLGAILLDLTDPTRVLARTIDPIFEPKEAYEKEGNVPNVVFSCGAVVRNDTLFVYYGGADKVLGVAKLSMKKLLKILLPDSLS